MRGGSNALQQKRIFLKEQRTKGMEHVQEESVFAFL